MKTTKKNIGVKAASYYELFDPGIRDHVIDLMGEWTKQMQIDATYAQDAITSCRKNLLEPLEVFVQECEARAKKHFDAERKKYEALGVRDHPAKPSVTTAHEAAFNLHDSVCDICEAWQSCDLVDISTTITRIQSAWTNFIVHGSAHRMYDDLPKERKQRSDAAKKPRVSTRKIDRAALEKKAKELLATGTERHNLAGVLANILKVTPKAIRDALPSQLKKRDA